MNYYPVTAALSAVVAELTSPEARRFYVNRSQQDLQTAFVLILQLGCFAYSLGAMCRQWAEYVTVTDSGNTAQPVTPEAMMLAEPAVIAPMIPVWVVAIASVTPAALPSFQPIALLNPAPKGKRGRKPKAATA